MELIFYSTLGRIIIYQLGGGGEGKSRWTFEVISWFPEEMEEISRR